MIKEQERTGFGKAPVQKLRNQRLKIGAAFDAIERRKGCIVRTVHGPAAGFSYLRPHMTGRFIYAEVIGLLRTNSGSDLVQHVVEFFLLHDSLHNCINKSANEFHSDERKYLPISFRRRARARCSVTPTTKADVFIILAI